MMKIIIVDDHPVVRRGLKQIILEKHSVWEVDEADTGLELLHKIKQNKYNVVLLDISMPGMNGLETLGELKRQNYDTPVLILSIHSEEQYAIRALKTGASGYLNKDSSSSELLLAIETLISGKKYISYDVSDRLVEYLNVDFEKTCHELLTDREYQIMILIASGNKQSDIADKLMLSIKTVSTHKSNIMRKMGINNDAELVRYALDNKLLD